MILFSQELFGPNWNKLSQFISSKSPNQVRTYHRKWSETANVIQDSMEDFSASYVLSPSGLELLLDDPTNILQTAATTTVVTTAIGDEKQEGGVLPEHNLTTQFVEDQQSNSSNLSSQSYIKEKSCLDVKKEEVRLNKRNCGRSSKRLKSSGSSNKNIIYLDSKDPKDKGIKMGKLSGEIIKLDKNCSESELDVNIEIDDNFSDQTAIVDMADSSIMSRQNNGENISTLALQSTQRLAEEYMLNDISVKKEVNTITYTFPLPTASVRLPNTLISHEERTIHAEFFMLEKLFVTVEM